jgi:hypothetical protein
MKLATPLLVAATLICGTSLACAGDRDSGTGLTPPGQNKLEGQSTTGVGTNSLIPPPVESYANTHQNLPREPTVRNPYMRADQDDFPGVRRRR